MVTATTSVKDNYSDLLRVLRRTDDQIIGLYKYGSMVYGSNTETSDEDYILILKRGQSGTILDYGNKSFVVHTPTSFQRGLWAHEPYALETFFLPADMVFKSGHIWDFGKIDLSVLRHSFSAKSSHSFVKAKKKIDVEKDFYRGKKSLFHSLRILDFGIQLAEHGKVQDFTSATERWWWDIYTDPSESWETYKVKYRPIHNGLLTRFREVSPK